MACQRRASTPTPRVWENRSLLPLAPSSPCPSCGLHPPATKSESSQVTSKGLCYVTGTLDLNSALSFLYHISRGSLAASVTCTEGAGLWRYFAPWAPKPGHLSDKGGDGQVSIRDHATEFQKDQWPRPGVKNSAAKGQTISIQASWALRSPSQESTPPLKHRLCVTHGCGCDPIKLYSQKILVGQIWPTGCSLPVLGLARAATVKTLPRPSAQQDSTIWGPVGCTGRGGGWGGRAPVEASLGFITHKVPALL